MKLVLIRHGQTAANLSAALDTRLPGLPLTDLGQLQAQSLCERFSKEVGDRLDALTVSAMTRTRQTTVPLCTRYGVKPKVSAQIREISAGDCEMSSSPVSIRIYVEACHAWMNADFAHRMPGAEDGYEFLARVVPIARDVMERAYRLGGDEGVGGIVAHGGLIRVLSAVLSEDIRLGVSPTQFMSNTGMAVFEANIHEFRQLRIGEVANLKALSWDGRQLD